MTKYELVVLVTTADKDLFDLLNKNLTKWQVKVIKNKNLGVKTLAYPIKKNFKANYNYYLLEVSEKQNLASKLDRFFHINNKNYLRHLLVLQENN